MKLTNQLGTEISPYLLQHAHNPVAWQPWGEAAFQIARDQNKPILLSVGCATCHWCHVMAHESFEDETVAALINQNFVPIKVDREERPDIDGVYMTACQVLTGSGGWPLTVFLTPDLKPFFAATYIPKETNYGRIGLLDLLPRIADVWHNRPGDVADSANQVQAALQETSATTPEAAPLDATVLMKAFEQLEARFDAVHGGFGTSPKFPTPHQLIFLLRYWKETGNQKALEMVEQTLQGMRRGGICDQVGLGFHRYSTDEAWLVPHFEKMLYDQALISLACLEAYQATANEDYARTAREVFEYVLRDLRDEQGAFYSAEDADSEGEEGKFYLWTVEEVRAALDEDKADLFEKGFNLRPEGNFNDPMGIDTGRRNIPHLTQSYHDLAASLNITEAELTDRLTAILTKLRQQRAERPRPFKDDKILTDWNGLMIAALARGGRVLRDSTYTEAARAAADFLMDKMLTPKGRQQHRYRQGNASIEGNLDDYAFLVFGLTELYQATLETKYLSQALALNRTMVTHFHDKETGGFYFTPDDAESLIVRRQEVYDGALPSGNSIAMLNLLTLARLIGDPELEKMAKAIPGAFAGKLAEMPSAYTQLMVAYQYALVPSQEVVVVGKVGDSTAGDMIEALNRGYSPNTVVLFKPEGTEGADIERLAPFTAEYRASEGQTAAYVCRNQSCQLPVTTVGELQKLMQ